MEKEEGIYRIELNKLTMDSVGEGGGSMCEKGRSLGVGDSGGGMGVRSCQGCVRKKG